MTYEKHQKVVYTAASGAKFSARVETRHRSGALTVKLLFPLEKNGREMDCGYMGDRYRVDPTHLSELRQEPLKPLGKAYRDEGQEPRSRHVWLPGVWKR